MWESAVRDSRSDSPDWPIDVDVIRDVVLDEREVAVHEMRDVRRVAREQIVDADDGITAIEECFGQVGADESCRPGDDNALFHGVCVWKLEAES